MTHEEQVLLDALRACGFDYITLWDLKCLEAAVRASRGPWWMRSLLSGNNWQRLTSDLIAGEENIHAEAKLQFRQAQCKHPRLQWEGRTAICSDCGKRAALDYL